MDCDLMEWMKELGRSNAVENATTDNYLTSATPSNYDHVHNNVGSTDASQELKEEGEKEMDWDLTEWMKELERSDAVENVTTDNYLTSSTPSNYDHVHNNVGSTDGSQELKEEGEGTTGKVGEGLVEEHQIVKVMTDEQKEELRWQMSAFDVISMSPQESYRRIASEYLSQHVSRIGNPSSDPLKATEGYKQPNRKQRWSATPMQRLILDNIYHSGKVSPSKEEIKWITSKLSQHGAITGSNVYNWFQNRRTREKRKMKTKLAYNIKSEVELGAESSNGKKIKLQKANFDDNQYLSTDAHFLQTSEVNSEMHFINQEFHTAQDINPSICNLSPSDPSRMPFIERTQTNPSNYYVMGDDNQYLSTDAHFFQTSEVNSEMHFINQEFHTAQDMNPSICNLSCSDPSQMPFIEKTQANPSNDYLMRDDNQYLSTDAHFFQTSKANTEMHFINQKFHTAQNINPSICNLSPSGPSQMPFIEKTQTNPSNDYLMGDDNQYLSIDANFFQTLVVNSEMHFINQEFYTTQDMNPSICNLNPSNPSQISFIEKTQTNPSNDYLMGDIQIPVEFDSFDQQFIDDLFGFDPEFTDQS